MNDLTSLDSHMKTSIIIGLSLAALAGSAAAADLPSHKAIPPYIPPQAPMWTGFHVGLNAGGTFGNNSALNGQTWNLWNNPQFPADSIDYTSQALLSGSASTFSAAAFIGGGQIGYDWQVPFKGMNFVTGVEADMQGMAGSGGNKDRWLASSYANAYSSTGSILSNQQGAANLSYIGTVRGRLGYLAMPTLLVYGTGGLAYGGVNARIQNTQIFQDHLGPWNLVYGQSSYSNTQVGWTVGGGAEWMFMPNWSAKAEYLYYDLGRVSGTVINTSYALAEVPNGLQSATNYSGRISGNIVRLGVNYHFNFGTAPVVVKF